MVESKLLGTSSALFSFRGTPSPQPSLLPTPFTPQSMFRQPPVQQSPDSQLFITVEPPVQACFSIDVILGEINDEFKDIRGDLVFIRKPAVEGLEIIRDAIRRNTKELIDKLNSMKALNGAEEKKTKSPKKKIKQAILDGQSKTLECRIKLLEDLWIEYC